MSHTLSPTTDAVSMRTPSFGAVYQISPMMVALDKTPLPPGMKPYFP